VISTASASSSAYQFIAGPVQATIEAWQAFALNLPGEGPPHLSVNFVPASQGCFLVIQTREDSRLRALSGLFQGHSPYRDAHAILHRFCAGITAN
jgi:hypothetical protein